MKKTLLLTNLSTSIGDFIEYWGFRAIDGKVWTLIFLSNKPISTPEIVKTLGVSKGLVSIAINELLDYELIKLEGKVEHGAQTYIANMDIAKILKAVLKNRELLKISEAENCIDSLSKLSNDDFSKLNISKDKLKKLQTLTKVNKGLLQNIVLKKITTLDEWIRFLKLCKKFI